MLPTISLNTRTAAILCIKLPGDYSVRPLSQGEFRAASHVMEINKVPTSDMLTLSAAQLTKMFNGEELLCERILSLRDRHHKIENVLKSWSENGIWILGEEDDFYPKRLKDRLTSSRPPLLFGFGPFDSLNDGGLLVVGSRNSSPKAIEFSETLAKRCAKEAITVISSNMRGVDRAAIQTVLANNGSVKIIVTDKLEKVIDNPHYRAASKNGQATLMTPFSPNIGFSIPNAIRANRYQYALSDIAIIVETRRTGGIWQGADENRKEKWVPAYVRSSNDMPPGNTALLHLGLRPITQKDISGAKTLESLLLSKQSKIGRPVAPIQANNSVTRNKLFDYFIDGLKILNQRKIDTNEEQIANHFGLEPIQVKTWLEKASSLGKVEKVRDKSQTLWKTK